LYSSLEAVFVVYSARLFTLHYRHKVELVITESSNNLFHGPFLSCASYVLTHLDLQLGYE